MIRPVGLGRGPGFHRRGQPPGGRKPRTRPFEQERGSGRVLHPTDGTAAFTQSRSCRFQLPLRRQCPRQRAGGMREDHAPVSALDQQAHALRQQRFSVRVLSGRKRQRAALEERAGGSPHIPGRTRQVERLLEMRPRPGKIAARLGIVPGTSKSQLSRARSSLRAHMARAGRPALRKVER